MTRKRKGKNAGSGAFPEFSADEMLRMEPHLMSQLADIDTGLLTEEGVEEDRASADEVLFETLATEGAATASLVSASGILPEFELPDFFLSELLTQNVDAAVRLLTSHNVPLAVRNLEEAFGYRLQRGKGPFQQVAFAFISLMTTNAAPNYLTALRSGLCNIMGDDGLALLRESSAEPLLVWTPKAWMEFRSAEAADYVEELLALPEPIRQDRDPGILFAEWVRKTLDAQYRSKLSEGWALGGPFDDMTPFDAALSRMDRRAGLEVLVARGHKAFKAAASASGVSAPSIVKELLTLFSPQSDDGRELDVESVCAWFQEPMLPVYGEKNEADRGTKSDLCLRFAAQGDFLAEFCRCVAVNDVVVDGDSEFRVSLDLMENVGKGILSEAEEGAKAILELLANPCERIFFRTVVRIARPLDRFYGSPQCAISDLTSECFLTVLSGGAVELFSGVLPKRMRKALNAGKLTYGEVRNHYRSLIERRNGDRGR